MKIFLILGSCLILSGCSGLAATSYLSDKLPALPKFTPISGTERTNYTELRRANAAAADVLFQGAHAKLNTLHKVRMVELTNLGEPLAEGTSTLAWLVPQHIGNRLAQLGMNVKQPNKAPLHTKSGHTHGAGGLMHSKEEHSHKDKTTLPLEITNKSGIEPINHRHAGWIYIEGDYAHLQDELLISMRLVDGRTNQILSSVEYDMKVDRDIYVLLDPRAPDRIFGNAWMQ